LDVIQSGHESRQSAESAEDPITARKGSQKQ
jgi:hypothetical protein